MLNLDYESDTRRRVLKVFQLVMINVIAVDSIRSLPYSAVYGFSLVFYYLLAGLFFFIPSGIVAAELATGWPNTGGIYIWVREAFGKRVSTIVIWLNWTYNLAWYPTVMALMAGAIAYLINPALASNKYYLIGTTVSLFWLATFANYFGMKISSNISILGAIIGTISPMLLIGFLGLFWIYQERPLEIEMNWKVFFPKGSDGSNLAMLSNVLFGLLGLEMSTTHVAEVKDPEKNFPKAIFYSMGIILVTITLGSLAIAIVVPQADLNLITGALQAFSIFFNTLHMPWMIPVMAILIILGGLGAVSAWIIGPTKGVMVAARDKVLPDFFARVNKKRVPVNVLLTQAVIVSILSSAFVLMPNANSAFLLLSSITAQLALIVYLFMFAAAIKLHYSHPHVKRSYHVPGGKIGMWVISMIGCITIIVVLFVGFIPPQEAGVKSSRIYQLYLIGGMVGLCLIPVVLQKCKKWLRPFIKKEYPHTKLKDRPSIPHKLEERHPELKKEQPPVLQKKEERRPEREASIKPKTSKPPEKPEGPHSDQKGKK